MGYVSNKNGIADKKFVTDATYEIEVAGERISATASLDPFYDPKSSRVKS
jgi:4-methylaminobutanoate oxidase (formaldehyde-forming)